MGTLEDDAMMSVRTVTSASREVLCGTGDMGGSILEVCGEGDAFLKVYGF